MCSACRRPGATLGCFFKSCPSKYHYRCALESGECHPLSSCFPHSTREQSALAYPPARWQEPLQHAHSFLTYMDYADSTSEVICVEMESWTESLILQSLDKILLAKVCWQILPKELVKKIWIQFKKGVTWLICGVCQLSGKLESPNWSKKHKIKDNQYV